MKNAATIFLLVLLVSIQTPLGQLLKLPMLVEHYIKHQKQEVVSFIDFLHNHYASDHTDADLPEDEQLPFKNIPLQAIGYAIVTPETQEGTFVTLPMEKKVVPDTYSPQKHLASIFHPPRV